VVSSEWVALRHDQSSCGRHVSDRHSASSSGAACPQLSSPPRHTPHPPPNSVPPPPPHSAVRPSTAGPAHGRGSPGLVRGGHAGTGHDKDFPLGMPMSRRGMMGLLMAAHLMCLVPFLSLFFSLFNLLFVR
jgi:hypothetical protein